MRIGCSLAPVPRALGFTVYGLRFRVQSRACLSRIRAKGLLFRVSGVGFRAWSPLPLYQVSFVSIVGLFCLYSRSLLSVRVQDVGLFCLHSRSLLPVQGLGCRVQGLVSRLSLAHLLEKLLLVAFLLFVKKKRRKKKPVSRAFAGEAPPCSFSSWPLRCTSRLLCVSNGTTKKRALSVRQQAQKKGGGKPLFVSAAAGQFHSFTLLAYFQITFDFFF